jgi:hypothetical protein
MKNLTGTAILITGCRRLPLPSGERKIMGTEIEGCVLGIHLGGETHFDLRHLTVVEKSVTKKCQSNNSTTATPCLQANSIGFLNPTNFLLLVKRTIDVSLTDSPTPRHQV